VDAQGDPGRRRAAPGTGDKPRGRGPGALNGLASPETPVFFVAYQHRNWHRAQSVYKDDTFIWECYYSEAAFGNALERLKAEEHPLLYAGRFILGALFHPKIAEKWVNGDRAPR